jgi:hypothetical protein
MPDANYMANFNSAIGNMASNINICDFNAPSASSIRFQTRYHNTPSDSGAGTLFDYVYNFVSVHR